MAKKTTRSAKLSVPTKSRYVSGDFAVYNPQKYVGEMPIRYLSSYELRFMKMLEMNPTVKCWNSENIIIPYLLKVNGVVTRKRYYMDFEVISKSGKKYIIEVKPISKTPKKQEEIMRNPENYMNACKWKSAIKWALRNDYTFAIVGENNLGKFINF